MLKEKPPLGIIPKKLHDEERLKQIVEAIIRYVESHERISSHWIDEYHELIIKEHELL